MGGRRWAKSVWLLSVIGLAGVAVLLARNLGSKSPDAADVIVPSNASAPATDPRYGPIQSIATGYTARTDRGDVIELRMMPRPSLPPNREREVEAWMAREFPEAVRVGSPDVSYNCHGWIVTGGRYWIEGPDFEAILRDNGYQPQSAPRPEDLVVYWGAAGEISHSGLVRKVADSVMVESKWGALHRVLHAVGAQPFGGRWTFYRTKRTSHLLSVDGSNTRVEGGVPIQP